MIGAILGDIIGSRFEFNNHRSKEFELFTDDCHFTDDTVEIIAIADAIDKGISYKDSLVHWCSKYRNAGFSRRFLQWIDNPKPYKSHGNGTLMRICSFGYARTFPFDNIDFEINKAVRCSHDSTLPYDYCCALVYGIRGALRGNREEIVEQANYIHIKNFKSVKELQKTNRFDPTCEGTLPVVISCFIESDSFEDAIRNAVSVGGDTDTIASITGALAGAYYGVPQEMINKLKDYLPFEMYSLVDKFTIDYDGISVPFWADPACGPVPEEFRFIETKTIFN